MKVPSKPSCAESVLSCAPVSSAAVEELGVEDLTAPDLEDLMLGAAQRPVRLAQVSGTWPTTLVLLTEIWVTEVHML
jgi:hypothetical protein